MNLDENPTEAEIRKQRRLVWILEWVPIGAGAAVVIVLALVRGSWTVLVVGAGILAIYWWADQKWCITTSAPILLLVKLADAWHWLRARRRERQL